MKIENISIDKIIPYARNPRNNDQAVSKVKASIKEFGFQQPIVVDKEMVVIVGHTRLKAAIELGMESAPVHIAKDLTPTQVKAYRLADNRVGEEAEWDQELLGLELEDLKLDDFDLELTGFSEEEMANAMEEESDNAAKSITTDDTSNINTAYTKKIDIPEYKPTGEKPAIQDLCSQDKYQELLTQIKSSSIEQSIKNFLQIAACRHIVFNYENIAEYYCHADAETQELMESSALVLLDFDSAMRDGYLKMSKLLSEIMQGSQEIIDEDEIEGDDNE